MCGQPRLSIAPLWLTGVLEVSATKSPDQSVQAHCCRTGVHVMLLNGSLACNLIVHQSMSLQGSPSEPLS